jgi:hypothetical protein
MIGYWRSGRNTSRFTRKLAPTARVNEVVLVTGAAEMMRKNFKATGLFHSKFGPSMSFAIHSQIALLLSERIISKGEYDARDLPTLSKPLLF